MPQAPVLTSPPADDMAILRLRLPKVQHQALSARAYAEGYRCPEDYALAKLALLLPGAAIPERKPGPSSALPQVASSVG